MSITQIIKPKAPKTLRAALVKGVRGPVMVLAFMVIGYAGASLVAPAAASVATDSNVPSYTENLIAGHGCWTNEATMPADMAGEFPTHAIVILPGKVVPEYVGKTLTDKALDVSFGNVKIKGFEPIAYCR